MDAEEAELATNRLFEEDFEKDTWMNSYKKSKNQKVNYYKKWDKEPTED